MQTNDTQRLIEAEKRLKAMTIDDIKGLQALLSSIETNAGLNGGTAAGKVWWWCLNRIEEIKNEGE